MHHIHASKASAMFLKLDFTKAFDSMNWDFLQRVIKERDFPRRWTDWVRMILSTFSTRVLVNGEPSLYFLHKKGLRQGDPLSPMLFNLAVDILQRMVQSANHTLSNPIKNRISQAIWALQYADDTALIVKADEEAFITTKLVIRLFTKVLCLHVNYGKSSFVPINVPNAELVCLILECQPTDFPVNYLGMPLTVQKSRREHLMPLVKKIERKLEGWKGNLLLRACMLVLVNSVLSSMHIYFMGCFLLPKWMIKRIDKVRKHFLWGKGEGDAAEVPLINWNVICAPKHCCGLGIPNLELRNVALLLRWW